jgi:uroporphyrinogen decarboxylase
MNEMSSIERMNALFSGKSLDKVPFLPFDLSCGAGWFCARNVGYPVDSVYNDPEKSFWAQVWTKEQYKYDGNPVFSYASYGAWEFGGEIKFPAGEWEQAPSITKHPVASEEDIDSLELPDIKTAGVLPMTMQFSQLQDQHNMPIIFPCGSSFTCAGNIVDLTKFCIWLVKKPTIVHRLLRIVTDHLLQVAQYWVDTFGAERTVARDILPIESNQIISPKHFKEFSLPYLKEVHEKVLGMGVKRFYTHICGEQNLNLPIITKIPMGDGGIVSFGHEVDLNTAIKHFGDKCIIAGNVEPAVIQMGTPDQVYELSKECIKKGKSAPKGYILTAGCDIPPLAPPYNIYIMNKAVNDFGRYD